MNIQIRREIITAIKEKIKNIQLTKKLYVKETEAKGSKTSLFGIRIQIKIIFVQQITFSLNSNSVLRCPQFNSRGCIALAIYCCSVQIVFIMGRVGHGMGLEIRMCNGACYSQSFFPTSIVHCSQQERAPLRI